jgi:hypothetical protein
MQGYTSNITEGINRKNVIKNDIVTLVSGTVACYAEKNIQADIIDNIFASKVKYYSFRIYFSN